MVPYWTVVVWNIMGGIAGIAWLRVMYLVFTQPKETFILFKAPDENGVRKFSPFRTMHPFWIFSEEARNWHTNAGTHYKSKRYKIFKSKVHKAILHFVLALLVMVFWVGILLLTGIA